jgi:hypothetical protein
MLRVTRGIVVALMIASGIAIAFPALALGGWVAFKVGGAYVMRTDFDSARWQKAAWSPTSYMEKRDSRIRMRMLHDLMRRHELRAMNRAELVALLGESDHAVTGSAAPLFPGWDMVYNLGPERSIIALDEEWLAIRFDGNERVEEVRIIQS